APYARRGAGDQDGERHGEEYRLRRDLDRDPAASSGLPRRGRGVLDARGADADDQGIDSGLDERVADRGRALGRETAERFLGARPDQDRRVLVLDPAGEGLDRALERGDPRLAVEEAG